MDTIIKYFNYLSHRIPVWDKDGQKNNSDLVWNAEFSDCKVQMYLGVEKSATLHDHQLIALSVGGYNHNYFNYTWI